MAVRWRWLLLLLSLLPAILLANGCSEEDIPVARINDATITRQQLDHFIRLMSLCNPDLDNILNTQQEDSVIRKIELEFLQILIDGELVRQEVERLSLSIDGHLLEQKTEALVKDLVNTHYHGLPEQFLQRRKKLRLSLEDLSLIPLHELQLQALFDYLSDSLTEKDLLQFVEENPELLHQAAAREVYRLIFSEENDALHNLEKLRQGTPIEVLMPDFPGQDAEIMGWVTEDDPFVETTVRELLFSLPHDHSGDIIQSGDRYILYWVRQCRPASLLNFEEVKEEALLRKQYVLYQDYFNALWSEGEIEIYYDQ